MEVIVIGAGVFGSWIALSLAQAGHQVTLLDQKGPGNESSSSAGESRIIRSAYGGDKVYTVMARRSLRLWLDFFEKENQLDCFRETGVLWMAPASEGSIWQAREIFERLGIIHQWLDTNAIRTQYPQFEIPAGTVALYEREAGALLAERSIQVVMNAALRAGITYETAEVKPPALDRPGLEFIETTHGRRLSADHFVFACGSWLPKLFSVLTGVIRPTRQDLFFFAVPNETDQLRQGALPIWIDQTDNKIAYGFPDFGSGLKLGFHRLGAPFDPDGQRGETSSASKAEAADYVGRRLPLMQSASMKATHVCHYENTRNGDFLIDVHPEMQNVWFIGGGSGHGFKHAPAIAGYLSGLILGAPHREPRFSLAGKGSATTGRVL